MPVTSQIYDSITDIDPSEWNQLRSGEDPFMDPQFIRAIEISMAEHSRFHHVVFRNEQGTPIATACMSSYRVDAALLADGWAKSIAVKIGKIAPILTHFRVVFCGLPFSAGQSNVRISPDADCNEILGLLDELLFEFAKKIRARCIVYKEFTSEDCVRFAHLEKLGYRQADSLPMNVTSTEPDSFADYLSSLKSKRRSPITRMRKKFAATDYRVVQTLGGEEAARLIDKRVHGLYEYVYSRANVRLEKLSPAVFPELARHLPDNTAFTFIYDSDEIIAFAASIFCQKSFHQMFVGYDAEKNAESDLYFNLFFEAIDFAFKQKCEILQVGQSADDFKHQKLSCRQKPLSFYIRGVDLSTRVVLASAFKMLFPAQPIRFPVEEIAADSLPQHAELQSASV